KEYYAAEGLQDQIRFEYDKGSYVPRFSIAGQASHPDPSLAVLPFNNIGAEKEGDYLSDGLTKELILALSRIPGLRVVARTSTFCASCEIHRRSEGCASAQGALHRGRKHSPG